MAFASHTLSTTSDFSRPRTDFHCPSSQHPSRMVWAVADRADLWAFNTMRRGPMVQTMPPKQPKALGQTVSRPLFATSLVAPYAYSKRAAGPFGTFAPGVWAGIGKASGSGFGPKAASPLPICGS